MALSLPEQLRAQRARTEKWIQDREAELRRLSAQAEAKGRQVYAQAIKTGEKVLARTPAELRQLGLAAVQGRLPEAVAKVAVKTVTGPKPGPRTGPPSKARPGSKVGREVQAGVSGFVDEASMGLADRVLAAGDAAKMAVQQGDWDDFAHDYDEAMAIKRQEDAYDKAHHGLSRSIGVGTGFVGSVAAFGAPRLTARVVTAAATRRLPELALKFASARGPDPRGLATMAGIGGGAAGAIDQVVGDTVMGRRTKAGDLAAATASGALGGVATRYVGPGLGGAAGGGVGSILGDLANGEDISTEKARRAVQAGALSGALSGHFVGDQMSRQNSRTKGMVGETMSEVKARVRGERVVGTQQRVKVDETAKRGGYTVADYVSVDPKTGRVRLGESKMGPSASLTYRQTQAQNQFGDDYIVDYWRFSDVGKAGGAAVSPFGQFAVDEAYRRRE